MAEVKFDFDEIEAKLDLVVPDIYRMFIDAVIAYGYDLRQYRIYHDTETLLKGNRHMRRQLGDEEPLRHPLRGFHDPSGSFSTG